MKIPGAGTLPVELTQPTKQKKDAMASPFLLAVLPGSQRPMPASPSDVTHSRSAEVQAIDARGISLASEMSADASRVNASNERGSFLPAGLGFDAAAVRDKGLGARNDRRGAHTPSQLPAVEWPWAAIAIGSLSYRAPVAPSGSDMSTPTAGSARPQIAHMPVDALNIPASRREGEASAEVRHAFTFGSMATLSVETSPSDEPTELSASALAQAWSSLDAETVLKRRVQLHRDGDGQVRVLMRDFGLSQAEIASWVEEFRELLERQGEAVSRVWVNGHAYPPLQGENHAR